MALSSVQRKELLARNLPQSREVRRILTEYLQRTTLHPDDFAKRIGYAGITLRMFLAGKYHSIAASDRQICAAIIDFIESHPAGTSAVPGCEGKLYATEDVKLIREFFYKALDNRQAYYVHGDPGSQKTFTALSLVEELNRNELCKNGHGRRAYMVYCRQGIRPVDLLKRVAEACGSITNGSADRIIRNLRFDFRARKVVIVFDEAQHLDVDCLETIRELLDMPPHFGLLFLGSHELQKTFQRLDLEQLASRMRKGADLPGISEEEAKSIIGHELPKLSGKAASVLIESSYVKSLRKRAKKDDTETTAVSYISARKLFGAIDGIKERQLARPF